LKIARMRARPLVAQAVVTALVCWGLVAMSLTSEELRLRRSDGDLHAAAPRLHFLSGKALDRLHDGAAVPFDFQFTVAADSKNNVVARAFERFTVSYDVWEEKFSVARRRDYRKSGSNLSAIAAESWCLDNIVLPVNALPAGRELWARLEIRSLDPREQTAESSDPGISITTLIELFSRPARAQQDHWSVDSRPFHLADLTP
jgi:hypothetical protein